MFQPLLSKFNKVDAISWTQYTPYFNDGDTCEFSAHVDNLSVHYDGEKYNEYETFDYGIIKDENDLKNHKIIKELRGYGKDVNIGEEGYILNEDLDINDITVSCEIKKVLSDIPEEFLKDLFGDHVEVKINKDGSIDVSEYEHE